MLFNNKKLIFFLFAGVNIIACKKTIQIPPPTGTITTSQVFSSDNQAISAASGMYFNMINTSRSFSNYGMSIFCGMSADELIIFDQTQQDIDQFQKNNLSTTNTIVDGNFWGDAYPTIYAANAIIEGLGNYTGVHDSLKNELTGEAEFIRAFCNFYLVNLFGNIPLVTTINWHKTNVLSRTSVTQVYDNIISDLKDAKNRLASDYSAGVGQRIIPNKWAATALLARAYLYTGDYANAEEQADSLISNTSLYSLDSNINQVFLTNSSEAIWQLQQNNKGSSYNATPEGFILIPSILDSTYQPFAYITTQLLNAFEPGDKRRSNWIDSTIYNGIEYYFPYKYKIGPRQALVNGPYTEYYMVLRLAEQYLIRAEARAKQNKLTDATSDLNIIRKRAGLTNTVATSQTDLLTAITHERQVELFVEWGHRWLDLKRSNQATNVLKPIKSLWENTAQLYPIPASELMTDPNLVQNPGY
ncbi:MAG TPA: RagB/SusD family nutrient uptake outer membrane protein [Puia sp.]|nr:RagB/SusD family nutrient uptake outer membrane protein [Puia sp.]